MKTIFTRFVFTVSIISCFLIKITAQSVNVQDSSALVDIYNATNGPGWINHSNWLTPQPVSTWQGVIVSGNRVTELHLGSNNLKGSLPSSIGNLTAVTLLGMDFDSLSGSIPTAIGSMSSLQYMDLDFNQLTGNIPSSISNLSNLLWLNLYKNQLTGTIPSSFSNLKNLSWLQVQFNNLSGPFPAVVCDIPSLAILELEFNQFTGQIPNAIGRLTSLSTLDVDNNQLSGPIPDSVFSLPVVLLLLENNQFSGNIPAAIGNLQNTETVDLSTNQLSGRIPPSIGNIRATSINLSNNKLSGNLPVTLKNISGLSYLNVDNNRLTIVSAINFDPSWFPLLRELDFQSNRFTFNGTEAIAQNFPYKFTYSPQAAIPVRQHGTALAVSSGGTLSNNTYTWYEVGKTGNTVIAGDSIFQPAETGSYFVKVKNAVATKLTLSSDTFHYVMPIAATSTNATAANANASLLVFPNPVKNNVLHVQLKGSSQIIISDEAGRVLLTKSVHGNVEINVGSFANGFYYIRETNTGESKQFEISR